MNSKDIKKRQRPNLFLLFLVSITLVTISNPINSSTYAISPNLDSAQGLQISPALIELNATPGKKYNFKINIMNVTVSDLSYAVSVEDFDSDNETGSPHIMINENLPETVSVKTWLSDTPEFILRSHQSQSIDLEMTVPDDAEPGGHYGVIRFSGNASESDGNSVGLSASAGVLLLVKVDGNINEQASLVSFFSSQDGKQNSFFESSPITFVSRIKNNGNTHTKPSGTIEISDMFGGLVASLPVNQEKSNILPDGIRKFESTYNSGWMIGKYKANLALGYGVNGQAITSTITFWVIPYKIILVGLFVLTTIIFVLMRLIKVYNKHIITKAKAEELNKNQQDDEKNDIKNKKI